jgi:hypothetical protein
MVSHVLRLAAAAAAPFLIAALGACAGGANSQPCRLDGECASRDERYAFCLEARCVECVGRGSCGGHPCNGGVCDIPCEDSRKCPHGDACVGGRCAPG